VITGWDGGKASASSSAIAAAPGLHEEIKKRLNG